MNKAIETAILKTFAYFSQFSCPLTRQEVFQFLWVDSGEAYSRKEVSAVLTALTERGTICLEDGYFVLKGNESHIAVRMNRSHIIEHKMRIAKRSARVFAWIPHISAVFVCNQLQTGITEQSDIDVYIVVKPGYLWVTRLITTVLMSGFGLRRHSKCVADHICLSFFVTSDVINLKPIAIDETDVYLRYWNMQLIPMYDPYSVHEEILSANAWASTTLPHAAVPWKTAAVWSSGKGVVAHKVKRFFEIAWTGPYGKIMETQAKGIQTKKMQRNAASKQDQDTSDVIISDQMMKFHENDRRAMFQEQWKKNYAILLKEL
ncbi:MAG: hypothetical protein HOE53_03410 [Candidatus Magasanikbacteria bacterium]|jgi:hypothetical protein|nr:hypothetical protein [Candidatus Magasanikbacteria bacterium]